ncbi:MAG TPA: anti-sigma factor [Gaiellaceae bacterium]
MSEPPDLRELVGDDVPEEELAELERVDTLLRSVPAPPPEIPSSLTRAVREATPSPIWTRRRVGAVLALAAALSAIFFGVGAWVDSRSDSFDARASIPMQATSNASGASALIRLGPADSQGNWSLQLEARGLPELPRGGYYVLWLARDGEYAGTCGTFRVGPGTTTVTMNASYRLRDYDEWVISAVLPGQPEDENPPWLLEAPTGSDRI